MFTQDNLVNTTTNPNQHIDPILDDDIIDISDLPDGVLNDLTADEIEILDAYIPDDYFENTFDILIG